VRGKTARQTFPRWHLERAAPGGETPRRGAAVIPFPGTAARGRSVVTYPRALVMPDRRAEPLPGLRPVRRLGLGLAAGLLLAGLASLILA
jgi:hypothetical protein